MFVHNTFSPCSAKRRASDKDLPVSGKSLVSLTQDPGRGSGTSPEGTGNHIDVLVACSCNLIEGSI